VEACPVGACWLAADGAAGSFAHAGRARRPGPALPAYQGFDDELYDQVRHGSTGLYDRLKQQGSASAAAAWKFRMASPISQLYGDCAECSAISLENARAQKVRNALELAVSQRCYNAP
jgi:hypothetical protein